MKLESATPAQREAITTEMLDVLALAGPGAGKTETLATRIAHLAQNGVRIEEMIVLTFTNAGANEIARRVESILGEEKKLGFIGTLHSFSLRMLKELGSEFGYGDRISIISPESAQDLLASKAKTLGCKTAIKTLLDLKSKGRPDRRARMDLDSTVIASFLDDLKEAGVVDYDVLLQEFLRALTEDCPESLGFGQAIANRYSHLFVDEVQDSAPIDWAIYRSIPVRCKFYVGDNDQSIYGFRGSDVKEMIAHGRDSAVQVIKLEENFRSHTEICEGAQRLIEHNRDRLAKKTISVKGPGGRIFVAPPCINAGEEIASVARTIKEWMEAEEGTSFAVLARTNAIADGFRKNLPSCGVDVVETKRTDLPRDWSMARSYVELLANPENDALAFFHLIALNEKDGLLPAQARARAHADRRAAQSMGVSLNSYSLKVGRITNADRAIQSLACSGVSKESFTIAAEKFRELAPGASVLELALEIGEIREYAKEEDGDGVRVLTIHGAKGRQFDVVFLVGCEDECMPGRAAKLGYDAIEEDRRLCYVACTRARRELYVTSAESRITQWGQVVKRTPSRFIAELTGTSGPSIS